jgi:phospholipase C
MSHPEITRRSLLTGAAGVTAGAASLVYAGRLPAWARTFTASAESHLRQPDSRPFPHRPAGTPAPDMEQIKHIVVLMMENHSFDNFLGMLPHVNSGRHAVDGLSVDAQGLPTNSNRDADNNIIFARVGASPCPIGQPSQSWNASHTAYANGTMAGFVQASGDVAMQIWDNTMIPFSYSLAEYFPIGQRYFSSVMAQTYPNRRFFFCGTASGITATDSLTFATSAANGTFFDRLNEHRISWKNYFQAEPSTLIVPNFSQSKACTSRLSPITQFFKDAKAGKLPSFSFIDPDYTTTSQENPQDVQVGEAFIAKVVTALMKSPSWQNTALFITYDEGGGYYDHVPPPAAVAPDAIAPIQEATQPTLMPGGYNQYGFRVPLYVVSPWGKPGYLSSVVQDHTSITAFIERKWNLPAMTLRDANAHPMMDYFDFKQKVPAFLSPPTLAAAPALTQGIAECDALGLNPPLPTGVL